MKPASLLSALLLVGWACAGHGVPIDSVQYPSNVTEIIRGYGYPCEDYWALTPDGYYLSMQRIAHGVKNKGPSKGLVMFQHGLVDNANGIVLNFPNEDLVFMLADAGYEVWLGNNRGNGYSMRHVHYTPDQTQFWDFTWDEMATYDLPTQIEFVLKTTGASSLTYIGHSEGTTQAFAGFAESPVASKVNLFVALAPVAFVSNTNAILLRALAALDADELLILLGDHEFYLTDAIKKLLPDVCLWAPSVCAFSLDALMGPSTHTNNSRLDYYLTYEPNPTSVLNIAHWAQAVRTGTFQKFDYGSAGNMKYYNQTTPPQYNLGALPASLKIALFTGGNDYLADPKDAQLLKQALRTPPVYEYNIPDYSHTDFLWAVNAKDVLYPRVIALVDKYTTP